MSVVINGTGSISGLSNVGGVASAQSGSVLQVVQGTTATEVTNATTTYADTGLTATITPNFSTSKILVIVEQSDVYAPTTTGVKLQLLRSGNSIIVFGGYVVYNTVGSIDVGTCSTTYLDSPATTSAIIYKTQFANRVNSGNASGVQNGGAATSTITLMEIAA